jgi:Protein of unknown function (DUF3224)
MIEPAHLEQPRPGDLIGDEAAVQDHRTLRGTTVSGDWFVVPGSGTGELAGLRGEGGFTAELGHRADITLDYWFE